HGLVLVAEVRADELARHVEIALARRVPEIDALGLGHVEGLPALLGAPGAVRVFGGQLADRKARVVAAHDGRHLTRVSSSTMRAFYVLSAAFGAALLAYGCGGSNDTQSSLSTSGSAGGSVGGGGGATSSEGGKASGGGGAGASSSGGASASGGGGSA